MLECRSWGPLESFPLGFGFIVASIFVNVIRFAQQIYVAKVTLTVLQNRLNNANRFSHGRGHVWFACTLHRLKGPICRLPTPRCKLVQSEA